MTGDGQRMWPRRFQPGHLSDSRMAPQDQPDLEKLRRFALAIALVLITYSVALEFNPDREVSPLGLPFRVTRPELLPIGLALASICGAVRFWYFGIMKSESPSRHRKRALRRIGFGPKYEATRVLAVEEPQREEYAEQFQEHFPQVFGSEVLLEWEIDSVAKDVQETAGMRPLYSVTRMIVPRRTRCAMLLEQIDYTAPVWLNTAALGALLFGIVRS